ncbi:class I SAM-dependent methyltransferase [Canibacter zhoujuaniae]|uniref:class I SAM-dependent methyltransferase n=1 Tax=Canibacter zhoujuaniae TaxID=2708343 RepID=UPI0014206584|nr:methyltransferase [Canibacter zhoujuaniae]
MTCDLDRISALDRRIIADAQSLLLAHSAADILVLNDPTGALTDWATRATAGRVFVREVSYAAARTLRIKHPHIFISGLTVNGAADYSTMALGDFLRAHGFTGSLALGRLPKTHSALAELAREFSEYQTDRGSQAELLLGGNTKHMVKTFNDTIAKSFAQVRGLRGKGKHRCVLASDPRAASDSTRSASYHSNDAVNAGTFEGADTNQLAAFGGVFSGGKPDQGGALLAAAAVNWLEKHAAKQQTVLDLGCGNGSVSVEIMGRVSDLVRKLTATDIDMDAVRSTRVNLASVGNAEVLWDDAASGLPANSVDLLLLNPPFHSGHEIDMTLVKPLLHAAKRVLKPGGTMLLVHNSHARYRKQVAALFSGVMQLQRNRTYTLLQADP